MNSIRYKILSLWLLGLLTIPMGLVPSQVMNYLTGIFQAGSVDSGFSVVPIVIVFFLSIVGVSVLDVVQTIIKGISLESIVRKSSLHVFKHVLQATPDFFRKNQTTKISNRIVNEIRKTETFLLDLKTGLPLAVLGLFVFSYILFIGLDQSTPFIGSYLPNDFNQQGNWFLATLILLTSPMQAYYLLFDKKLQNIRMATAKADDDIADISYETVSNVREFRNHFAFDYAIFRMDIIFQHLRKIEIDFLKLQALFTGMGPIIDGIIKVALLAVGARLCVGDLQLPIVNITVDAIAWKDYMGFAGIAMLVNGYVGKLNNYLFTWRMSKESLRRINEFKNAEQLLDKSRQVLAVEGKNDTVLFENLDFETDDGIKILSDLSFNIKPGEHVALVGPSGCGKSTALNLILREINKSSGTLFFDNKDIEQCDFEKLCGEVAMVQQKPMLLNSSIRNNILLGCRKESSQTIKDGNFSVDISKLDDCTTIHDLNCQILEVIEKVALTPDIAQKGLDNKLPSQYKESKLLTQLAQLKESVCAKIKQQAETLFHPYAKDRYLYSSTILENILFGLLQDDDSVEGKVKQTALDVLIPIIKTSSLYGLLLWLGRQQYIHDRNIALRIKQMSPALADVLKSYKIAADNDEELSDVVGRIDADDHQSLQALSPKMQQVLLEVALSTSGVNALLYFSDKRSFEDAVVKTRNALAADKKLNTIAFDRFDAPDSAAAITLRQMIIGGQVETEVRGAFAKVDRIILQTLEEQNLLNDLLLMGLESPVGEGGRLLSGGQAMKVSIARVLLKKPNILLLDEATAALDEKSQAKIVALIEEDYKEKTVVMISHRLSTIKNYDKIFVFDRGHMVQHGKYQDLAETPGLFQDLVRQEGGDSSAPSSSMAEDGEIASQTGTAIQRAIALSPIFSGLHSEHIALLAHMANTVNCKANEVLFDRGDEGDELFIILSGQVEFFVTNKQDNTLKIIDEYGPGYSFGELAIFGEVARTLGARAKTDLRLGVINRSHLLKLIEINPELSAVFLKMISRQVAKLRDGVYL